MTEPKDVLDVLSKVIKDALQARTDESCPPEELLREYSLHISDAELLEVRDHVLKCGICYKKILDWIQQDALQVAADTESKKGE